MMIMRSIRRALTLLLLLAAGVGTTFAQTPDYSGVYYIGSRDFVAANTTTNYYLCPTEGWKYYTSASPYYTDSDNGQPFLTTYTCRDGVYDATKAVWNVEMQPDGYYHIRRALDGKYLTYNAKMESGAEGRMRLHLEATADGDNALFQINLVSGSGATAVYDIITKNVVNKYKYLNITGASNGGNGNQLSLQATNVRKDGPGNMSVGGILGLYIKGAADNEVNGKWYLEKAAADKPVITNNYDGTFTITAQSGTIYYTTDGTEPTESSSTYSAPITQTDALRVIKAIAKNESDDFSSVVTTYELPVCARPSITISHRIVRITTSTEGAAIHYTVDGNPATAGSTSYNDQFNIGNATTIRAIATKTGYVTSAEAKYLPPETVSSSDQITDMFGRYILTANFTLNGSIGSENEPFMGTIDGGLNEYTFAYPLVAYADGATIKNIILKNVTISGSGHVGAICNEAHGDCRIYNCGILGTTSTVSTSADNKYVGSIVGLLDDRSRVINCYSYATVSGGAQAAGIVGYNAQQSTQTALKTVVINCMFYGEITGGTKRYPVYGGFVIRNDVNDGINPYDYFRKDASFDNSYTKIDDYNRSWPAEEKNLTRFEYYRSVLNSNRTLCTWWINGDNNVAPTDEDIEDVGIAKWVLDPAIAPYPILKKWGYYPSVINHDPQKRFNPSTGNWQQRSGANEWEGKSYGTLPVTIQPGTNNSGAASVTRNIVITDMDTLNQDYGYYKIQLPYYNDVFGDPDGATHAQKYGNNYTSKVVTGWKITSITGGTPGTFSTNEETGYNFADRDCTNKDLYSVSGRVFAQGGYFYVPNGVTAITIEAYWGNAVYLANRGRSIDRVKTTISNYKDDKAFELAGTVSNTFQGQAVYDDLQNAIKALGSTNGLTVYDQAIVLIGNHQVKNGSTSIGYNGLDKTWHPFTIMSADFDFDCEPDYCLELQFRNAVDRPGIQPVRFDFLPVVELGLAVRHDNKAYSIGIFVPLGHFEITETAFMRTTQFEYDGPKDDNNRPNTKVPMIINGGEFEMFTFRYHNADRTSYFLLGGNAWIHRFAPGTHPNKGNSSTNKLCPVNAIGGQYPEFYLSGLYRPDVAAPNNQLSPYCYTDGGKFGTMAGAGYEKIKGNVTFKINHSLIQEFYGGGINGSNPVGGNINVTINNSRVYKYCGGPKVGNMTGKTVTTNATNTYFGVYYGGGNGGNSYYRELQNDGNFASSNIGTWTNNKNNWNGFKPLDVRDDDVTKENKGYHAEYEFEVFNESNGVKDEITQRSFINWIQFGTTITGNVSNTLTNCEIKSNFYGGGNLATVNGTVTSILDGTTVHGNAFGAGYSATIPTFSVHDKSTAVFPSMDYAGTITDGHIDYVKENGDPIKYKWTNDLNGLSEDDRRASPEYKKDGVWYCYTWASLDNLGAVLGNATLNIQGNTVVEGKTFNADGTVKEQTGGVFGGGDASPATNTAVTVNGGNTSSLWNVYGGGNKGPVSGNTSVTMQAGAVANNLYGGGNMEVVNGNTTVSYNGGNVTYDVFGGGNLADVLGTVNVNVTGGTIGRNLYGGGALANTNTANWDATANENAGGWAQGKTSATNTTTVSLTGGTVTGAVYGGALGDATHYAQVYGDVLVKLNDGVSDTGQKGCVVSDVFGANNANGTPRGNITVHIYKTQNSGAEQITGQGKTLGTYDVNAVYGGGNKAAYIPYDPQQQGIVPVVVIDGCDRTSINSVYGGGNAAPVPGTQVTVNGTFQIDYVFGGGNGKGDDNPGADVGYYKDSQNNTVAYGTGKTLVQLIGGKINSVFGGSDTKGNVRTETAVSTQENQNGCTLDVDYIYGAGQKAEQDGRVKLILGCINDLDALYGGAKEAHIKGGVDLVITSGHFGSIFGGNDQSGTIQGPITLTIEENGCYPIEIENLYLGGNQAAYSIYGYYEDANHILQPRTKAQYDALTEQEKAAINMATPYDDPKLNIISCTSIGNVYGGGYLAPLYGSPEININMIKGSFAGQNNPRTHTDIPNSLGTIANVYGGGYEADVYGDTRINIGTESAVKRETVFDNESTPDVDESITNVLGAKITGSVYGGGYAGDIYGNTQVFIGTKSYADREGLNITGNVFGGGKGITTNVRDNVQVTIGSKTGDVLTGDATITGDVYGGSELGTVNSIDAVNATQDATTTVTLNKGTVSGSIYGGGYGRLAAQDVEAAPAKVFGPINVTVNGGTVTGDVFGCNNLNGSPQSTVNVTITGTDTPVQPATYIIPAVYGGGNAAAYNGTGGLSVTVQGGYVQDVFGGGLGSTATVTGNTSVTIAGDAHVTRNVYGGGNEAALTGNPTVTMTGGAAQLIFGGGNAANVTGNTVTTVSGGQANTVYGGGNVADVIGNTTIHITGGTLNGTANISGNVTGAVFGGGYGQTTKVTGTVTVNIGTKTTITSQEHSTDVYGGDATINGDVYGGSAKGKVNTTDGSTATQGAFTNVNLYGGTINANLYGGGLGEDNAGDANDHPANIYGPVTVTTQGGSVTNVFGCNNILGSPQGTVTVNINGTADEGPNHAPYAIQNVYGGGNLAPYNGYPQVTVNGGNIYNVYGGGLGETAVLTGTEPASFTTVTIAGGNVANDVYGGGSLANVAGNIRVQVTGGTVAYNVYGGGALAHTNTANWNFNGSTWATGMNTNNVTTYKTYVTLTGGIIGNAYGGGLGRRLREASGNDPGETAVEANVYGDIQLTVNGAAFRTNIEETVNLNGDDYHIPLTGNVYGANNLNGTPKGHIKVDVYSTKRVVDGRVVQGHDASSFEIEGVYGGGNLASYIPAGETGQALLEDADQDEAAEIARKRTQVNIHGCDETSIHYVYGGGNSASVPSTEVNIYGSYLIGLVFGGGNGTDLVKGTDGHWKENDGAPVTRYARVRLYGGKIGDAYGGSNAKGQVGKTDIKQLTPDANDPDHDCPLKITFLFGAGNGDEATVDNGVNLTIGACDNQNAGGQSQQFQADYSIETIIGGANRANVNGPINLTITSGVYDAVFGGNYMRGQVNGPITVNIEETDACQPLIIKNLYGAGMQADYPGIGATVAANDRKVTVNVKACTRIENVYGGGWSAGVNGSTEVNINMIKGSRAGQSFTQALSNPDRVAYLKTIPNIHYTDDSDNNANFTIDDAIGTIGNVYGGGFKGYVSGNATVNVGTLSQITFDRKATDPEVFLSGIDAHPQTITVQTENDTKRYTATTQGVNITGDVFGGGDNADIQGNTIVNIGDADVTLTAGLKVGGSVYGGGNMGSVGKFTYENHDYDGRSPGGEDYLEVGKPTGITANTGKCTVTIDGDAEIGPDNMQMITSGGPDYKGNVFGGSKGLIISPTGSNANILYQAYTYDTEVTIQGNAFIKGSVYGGSENGHVLHDTWVYIKGGQIGNGDGVNRRYTDAEWAAGHVIAQNASENTLASTYNNTLPECAHWPFGQADGDAKYATYDPYAKESGYYDNAGAYSAGSGRPFADDGHTYYGNVFGGGSGLRPYQDANGRSQWIRTAGIVEHNTHVIITGGHILTSIYGGCETTDVSGDAYVAMTGGTLGVPRTDEQVKAHPVTCYLFGAGKGDPRVFFNTWTNVQNAYVHVSDDARIYGSVFGGGEDGHVLEDIRFNIGGNTSKLPAELSSVTELQSLSGSTTVSSAVYPYIGTTGTSYFDGNVFGGGRGFSGEALTAGSVGGNITLDIENGTMLGSVYGGGRLASVGIDFTNADDPLYGQFQQDGGGKTYGYVTVNIKGGIIGNDAEIITKQHTTGGNVYGGSMGRITKIDGTSLNPIWPRLAQVKGTNVNITGGTIKGNVYGGGEFGTVYSNTYVTIGGSRSSYGASAVASGTSTIYRDVFGGGYGSADYTDTYRTVLQTAGATYVYTPTMFAGLVGGDTYVDICGGWVKKNVYGGGEMASVGIINYECDPTTLEYKYIHKHTDVDNTFALSWPYEYEYLPIPGGTTHVTVTGGRVGITGKDFMGPFDANGDPLDSDGITVLSEDKANETDAKKIKDARLDNGDIYGGSKGVAGDRYDMAFCANVKNTEVIINYTTNSATPSNYKDKTGTKISNYVYTNDCLPGSVYGGGENGHVYDSTKVTLTNGLVGHAIYGGGKGKDTYTKTLTKIGGGGTYEAKIYGLIAGKVYGNTNVSMTGGYVVRNIYGGGNMASVGVGNYAGGADDYSTAGYGEKAGGNLWDSVSVNSQKFLSSGRTTVLVTGGQVGKADGEKDGLPYGNIFGGCRGESAPNILESPRYEYCPAFFTGYVNETRVTIGTTGQVSSDADAGQAGKAPLILGSVYGGGQDGHVRRDATVTIKSGVIGLEHTAANITAVGTQDENKNAVDLNHFKWLHRGNVYGAGSGIGEYNYDFNYDGDNKDDTDPTKVEEGTYTNPLRPGAQAQPIKEVDVSTSAGSVTRFATINILGGIIHRNVYGGGSLASTGAPKIPPISIDGYRKGDTEPGHGKGKQTLNLVNIKGGTIGIVSDYNAGYGGNVYGASRGQAVDTRFNDQASFATAIWTEVNVKNNPQIVGSVYGGGELGTVKQGVDVNISGGTILHDVYGGGAYASTNTSSSIENNKAVYPDTKISLTGGSADNVYGGGLGSIKFTAFTGSEDVIQPTPDIAPTAGNVTIDLNPGTLQTGFKVNRIFGGNNLAGTPLGHILVHVHATQNPMFSLISQKFPKTHIEYNQSNEEVTKILEYEVPTGAESTWQYTDLSTVATALNLDISTDLATLTSQNASANDKQNALTNILVAIETKIEATTDRHVNYDVQAIYGGGNLSAYNPTNIETEYSEVVVDDCDYTSIYQVYGGGNAASVPATKLTINEAYEIYESFGGGNGADDFTLSLNGVSTTFPNPGANVGYKNYSHFVKENSVITVVEDDDANTKDKRQAKTQIHYGTGIAQTEIMGGKIHRVYGGSNQKGNIRVEARSFLQDANDDCPVKTDKTYGGSKNADLDGGAHTELDCVHDVNEIYGGSENAHLYSDVTLNITNGTFQKVFGGNNTSGTIHGAITVNIKEEGCQPIQITELYLGGYLAPYSVYGYYEDANHVLQPRTKDQYDLLTTEQKAEAGVSNPYNDPRINVISATSIGTIYGGGYNALLVGSPHINVNMEEGKVLKAYAMKDLAAYNNLTAQQKDDDGNKILPIGSIGTIYGGGNMATVDGNTFVEIGTGQWVNANGESEILTRNAAPITGYVFGGGNQGDISQNTYVTIINGSIGQSVYGGGNLADIDGNTNVEIGTGRWISELDANGNPVYETKDANGDIYRYKVKTPAVQYTSQECETTNAALPIITTSTSLTAAQATKLNELLSINTYSAGGHPTEAHATAYNATVNGYITTADVKTPAVWAWYRVVQDQEQETATAPTTAAGNTVNITGDVYGGGKGLADNFQCDKAMIGVVDEGADPTKRNGGTNVIIADGTIGGSVYGGGEIGRVEKNTVVTIGLENGTGSPVIGHDVFGAGQGVDTHGYSGLVRGNSITTIQGNAKVGGSVYGGGKMASLGRFFVAASPALASLHHVEVGMPYDLKSGGKATVIIRDNAVIGPDDMTMTAVGGPVNSGHVFGAGKGVVAYATEHPGRWYMLNGVYTFQDYSGDANEAAYLKYTETLGITNETDITIGGNAFIKGSVFGGSESGHVRENTHITIQDNCQIGNGFVQMADDGSYLASPLSMNRPYTQDEWAQGKLIMGAGDREALQNLVSTTYYTSSLPECASWQYGKAAAAADKYAQYDPYYGTQGYDSKGGRTTGDDGNTFYGNVFGGGSGYYPYKAGKWYLPAGSVGGNTVIDITGGHILTAVYGGNELTDVTGTSIIRMTGGTVGVPRTTKQADAHPVTCSLYGAGKGDSREFFDTYTNVGNTQVSVGGNARIFGSVFGGGQSGKVKDDTEVNISGQIASARIDNDVFGGGEQADVQGNTVVNISGAHILHNVYGGGKMGSVGSYNSAPVEHNKAPKPNDGALYEFALSWPVEFDYKDGTGRTTINITGGRIGTSGDDNGDVFGGSQGEIFIDWDAEGINIESTNDADAVTSVQKAYRYKEAKLANVKETYVNVDLSYGATFELDDVLTEPEVYDTDDKAYKRKYIIDAVYVPNNDRTKPGSFTSFGTTPCITGSVYGGAENGHVYEDTHIHIYDGIIGHAVYGGGKGKGKYVGRLLNDQNPGQLKAYTEKIYSLTAGKVYGNTSVIMDDGYVMRSVFGGGNLGSVGKGNYAGGQDDYSLVGYGELPANDGDNLWQKVTDGDYADLFMTSGKTYVNIKGGQIGYILISPDAQTYSDIETASAGDDDVLNSSLKNLKNTLSKKDDLPTGNVFGGCRGQSSPNGNISPRYLYIPDFFLGYVNQTEVIIGTDNGGPVILGSVYGGGQDGHVRRGTEVTVNNAEIGINYVSTGGSSIDYANDVFGITDMNDIQWKGRGMVFGAGSGIGTYKIKDSEGNNTGAVDYNYSSGSVTATTKVTVNEGAVIYQSVFGGGSLASVGPPNTGQGFAELNTTDDYPAVNGRTVLTHKSTSSTNIIINGGTVGHEASYEAGYGGNVFGAGRGNYDGSLDLGQYAARYATTIWTKVEARSGHILGNVFGGGQSGPVTRDTKVIIGEKVQDNRGGNRSLQNLNSSSLTAPTPAGGQQSSTGGEQPAQGSSGQTNAATQSQQNRTVTRTQAAP